MKHFYKTENNEGLCKMSLLEMDAKSFLHIERHPE